MARKRDEVKRGGMVPVLVEAVRVDVVGARKAKFCGLAVHHLDEVGDRAAYAFGNAHRGVVARVDKQAVKQLVERCLVAGVIADKLAVHGLDDVGDGVDSIEGDAAFQCDDGRHDLRRRGHGHGDVAVEREKDVSVLVYHGSLAGELQGRIVVTEGRPAVGVGMGRDGAEDTGSGKTRKCAQAQEIPARERHGDARARLHRWTVQHQDRSSGYARPSRHR